VSDAEHGRAPGDGTGRGRVAALDLGTRRIGVAYSDSGRTLASPWGTIARSGDVTRDRAAVIEAVRETEASTVVVGVPLSLSGEQGPGGRRSSPSAYRWRPPTNG
jgi:putative holliday junction resolvase